MRLFVTGLLAALCAAAAPPAVAGEEEWALLAGSGWGRLRHRGPVVHSTFQPTLRWSAYGEPFGTDWRRARVGLSVEISPLLVIQQTPRAEAASVALLGRFAFAGEGLRPTAAAGIGVMAANRSVPPGEFPVNYTPQAGVGLQYSSGRRAVTIEYRFQHVSNNKITHPNRGLNNHLLLVGFAWR